MDPELKPFWRRIFKFNWKFGLFLILIVCIPRFILVLQANASGNYGSIGLIMLISAISPFIFLTKSGRKEIGLTKPTNYKWLIIAFILGLAFTFLLYYLGQALYGSSYENWYAYIGKSYKIPIGIGQNERAIMFAIFAFTGMIFSPIGEVFFSGELFMIVLQGRLVTEKRLWWIVQPLQLPTSHTSDWFLSITNGAF